MLPAGARQDDPKDRIPGKESRREALGKQLGNCGSAPRARGRLLSHGPEGHGRGPNTGANASCPRPGALSRPLGGTSSTYSPPPHHHRPTGAGERREAVLSETLCPARACICETETGQLGVSQGPSRKPTSLGTHRGQIIRGMAAGAHLVQGPRDRPWDVTSS